MIECSRLAWEVEKGVAAGKECGERSVRLEKCKCGEKRNVSRNETAVSDAPTTTTLEFT